MEYEIEIEELLKSNELPDEEFSVLTLNDNNEEEFEDYENEE